jgi:23S rRNA (guanine745-N1)-methyltransferase
VAASILKCPVCHGVLTVAAAVATCEAGHSFDRARSGYLNLLLPNQRSSPEPGDSPDMLRSRRAILQAGIYDPMSDAVNAAVQQAIGDRGEAKIADLGCGEGFFLDRVKRAMAPGPEGPGLRTDEFYGVDISRAGVKMATTYDRSIMWIVASLHESPFLPASLDVALSMFAPIAADDVKRVLRPDGFLITATPGPDHLDALRAIIYPSVVPHAPVPAVLADDPAFALVHSTRARATAAVHSREQVMNLLAMTPYYWNISLDTKARVEACERLEFTVDVSVNVFSRAGTNLLAASERRSR